MCSCVGIGCPWVCLRECRELQPGAPVYLLGHSIFSHLFLAHLGQVPKEEQPDGIVALASGVCVVLWSVFVEEFHHTQGKGTQTHHPFRGLASQADELEDVVAVFHVHDRHACPVLVAPLVSS